MKSKDLIFWVLLTGAALLYAKDSPQLLEQLKGLAVSKATIDAPELPEPLAYRDTAESISTALSGQPEAAHSCCQLWWGIADTLLADDQLITSTKEVREANLLAGKLTFAGRTPPSPAVLTIAGDGLKQAMGGTPNRELTSDDRSKLIDYFRAIAWGAAQAK